MKCDRNEEEFTCKTVKMEIESKLNVFDKTNAQNISKKYYLGDCRVVQLTAKDRSHTAHPVCERYSF